MSRMIGTVSRGVRAPIIRGGDNLVDIVTDCILEAAKDGGYEIRNRDIVAMTESIVARAQENYVTIDDIAAGRPVDPVWRNEVDHVSHRIYSTGFYYGFPGQYTENSRYIREWMSLLRQTISITIRIWG